MDIKQLLRTSKFYFNKGLGQNFLTDERLLGEIVLDAGITKDDTVLEIGTGAGTLTRILAGSAKRVLTYEIDRALEPVLDDVLSGCGNVEVVFEDILKADVALLKKRLGEGFKLVANLPYYITTPIIFYFLEHNFPASSMHIMVQKEVAERMVAQPATKAYGVLTAVVWLYADAKIMRIVPREMFFPMPNVDSAVIRLTMRDRGISDRTAVIRTIKQAFAMRRKTLCNNLLQAYPCPKERLETLLDSIGISRQARGEVLTFDQFILLSEALKGLQVTGATGSCNG